jgi:plasmid stability protein
LPILPLDGRPFHLKAKNHPFVGIASGVDMRSACYNAISMSSMIQIRNVPDALHRELKVRAAQTGMTLSDYLLAELQALAVRPTMREWLARSEGWAPVEPSETPAAVIAAERERTAA